MVEPHLRGRGDLFPVAAASGAPVAPAARQGAQLPASSSPARQHGPSQRGAGAFSPDETRALRLAGHARSAIPSPHARALSSSTVLAQIVSIDSDGLSPHTSAPGNTTGARSGRREAIEQVVEDLPTTPTCADSRRQDRTNLIMDAKRMIQEARRMTLPADKGQNQEVHPVSPSHREAWHRLQIIRNRREQLELSTLRGSKADAEHSDMTNHAPLTVDDHVMPYPMISRMPPDLSGSTIQVPPGLGMQESDSTKMRSVNLAQACNTEVPPG